MGKYKTICPVYKFKGRLYNQYMLGDKEEASQKNIEILNLDALGNDTESTNSSTTVAKQSLWYPGLKLIPMRSPQENGPFKDLAYRSPKCEEWADEMQLLRACMYLIGMRMQGKLFSYLVL